MTLSDLAKTATGEDDDPIVLSTQEARDIIEVVADTDERVAVVEARNKALTLENAELRTKIALLEAQAETTRVDLAIALTPKASA